MTRAPKSSGVSVNHLLQQADQLSVSHLEQLIELLTLLWEAKQLPPIQPGESTQTESVNPHRGRARIELKYIPDSRGSGAVYGPYRYLRFMEGKRHKSEYLGKVELGKTGN